MKKSNVVFFGGKAVGYGVLKHLEKTDNIVGVFTNEDDGKTWYPKVYSQHKEGKVDWMVCAYYDKIFKKEELFVPAINIHMGLVQEYRGCYPTTLPIIDGKNTAGVTIHELTDKVDGGKVYCQAGVSIDPSETGQSLYYKCTGAAISLFREHWVNIRDGYINPVEVKLGKYYKRTDFPSHEIKLSWSQDKIDRHIRALTFPPFERPYFKINKRKFYVHI